MASSNLAAENGPQVGEKLPNFEVKILYEPCSSLLLLLYSGTPLLHNARDHQNGFFTSELCPKSNENTKKNAVVGF